MLSYDAIKIYNQNTMKPLAFSLVYIKPNQPCKTKQIN